jgi:hypothetical protein
MHFLPLRQCSELPHLLLYLSSVFFSLKDNIHGHLLMKIFISKLCPLQCNSGRHEG